MIDTDQELANYLPSLETAEWVAVDTEADSLHAYPEKVCLIQISTATEDRLIDPLSGLDLAPLLRGLSSHELIMHGADYDLRLLRKHHSFVPRAIFDTMLAARLLGMTQFSLSNLVESLLHVKLEKGPQKANWAVRPLTPRMEAYARNDTRYLKPLADHLAADLKAKGRLDWHRESCERLVTDCGQAKTKPDDLWRIKGANRLTRGSLAILRELWHWREAEAIRANKPPYFILSHEAMIRVSDEVGQSRPINGLLPKGMSERRRNGLLKAVEKGQAIPQEQQPRILRTSGRRASEAERRRQGELQQIRDTQAAKLGIDPTLIANKSMLSDLAFNWEKHAPDLMTWQRALLERSH